jgi:hypothetical protein
VRGEKSGYVISLRIREPDGPGFRGESSTDADDKECGVWIELAQNRTQWRAFLNTMISFRVA